VSAAVQHQPMLGVLRREVDAEEHCRGKPRSGRVACDGSGCWGSFPRAALRVLREPPKSNICSSDRARTGDGSWTPPATACRLSSARTSTAPNETRRRRAQIHRRHRRAELSGESNCGVATVRLRRDLVAGTGSGGVSSGGKAGAGVGVAERLEYRTS
jgi:hypothetical protein